MPPKSRKQPSTATKEKAKARRARKKAASRTANASASAPEGTNHVPSSLATPPSPTGAAGSEPGSAPESCAYCPFSIVKTAVEFSGFNILIYPCPCGEDHAHPRTVLYHHHAYCAGKPSLDDALPAPLPPHTEITHLPHAPAADLATAITWSEFERLRLLPPPLPLPLPLPAPTSPTSPSPAPSTRSPSPAPSDTDSAGYAERQRQSPDTCVTCSSAFTTRVQLFRNGRVHTPFVLFRCACGERFSREHPNMRVRVNIRQAGAAPLERDVEDARERVRAEYESAEAAEGRRRARERVGPWVLARGVVGEGGEGEESAEGRSYAARGELVGEWTRWRREMAGGRGALACDECGGVFESVERLALHKRGHVLERRERERVVACETAEEQREHGEE